GPEGGDKGGDIIATGTPEEIAQVKNNRLLLKYTHTVDSRYLEFDGTMEKIRVNRSSTQEELRRYRKCGLFNNERETTRAKF
ncbi:Excinuclease ABC subunit A, partial [Bathymodiolus thermophilus thioautotrophic gill symbiont]